MGDLKNWFIPNPLMKCIKCSSTALHCYRSNLPAFAGEIQVVCHDCMYQKWVVDHRG